MTSKQLTVLCIGDSPTASFLSWQLCLSHCYTILVECTHASESSLYWRKKDEPEVEFAPEVYIDKANEIQTRYEEEAFPQPDFVILGLSTRAKLKVYFDACLDCCKKSTVFIVDCSCAVGLDSELQLLTPDHACYAAFSDIAVRVDKKGAGHAVQIYKEDAAVYIGNSLLQVGKESEQSQQLKNMREGEAFATLIGCLKTARGIKLCHVIPSGRTPTLGSYCWKKIIPFVDFEILSLIYSSLDTGDQNTSSIIQGTFCDLLQLARKTGALEFPLPSDQDRVKTQFNTMASNYNRTCDKKYQVKSPGVNNSTLNDGDSKEPDTLYNFCNGTEPYARLALTQLLALSRQFRSRVPYLECIYGFYKKIEKLRTEGNYDWAKQKNMETPRSIRQRLRQGQRPLPVPLQQQQPSFAPMAPLSAGGLQPYSALSTGSAVSAFSARSAPTSAQQSISSGNDKKGFHFFLHPRFSRKEIAGSAEASANGEVQYGTVINQVKNTLFRPTSASSYESFEDIARSQKALFEIANVGNMIEDTTSRYGTVDTIQRVRLFNSKRPEGSIDSSSLVFTDCTELQTSVQAGAQEDVQLEEPEEEEGERN